MTGRIKIMNRVTGLVIMFAMIVLNGCAAKVAPVESLSSAAMGIKVAQERNAATFAPLELKIAEDKLHDAKAAVQKEDFDRARRLAEEALMDARLAETKALSEKAKRLAQDMRNSIETLRHEIERTQKMKLQ